MEHRSWVELEDDVVIEILVRLPLDDLGRCKVVCKEWCNLISSPVFVSQHLLRSKHLILVHDMPPRHFLHETPGPFKSVVCFSSYSSFVVGSVNGLICVADQFNGDIWILNPVTQLSIRLPLPASPTVDDRDQVSLAFCWDPCDEQFKVFKIVCEFQQRDLDLPDLEPPGPHSDYELRPIVSNRIEVWQSRYPRTWTPINFNNITRSFYHPSGWFTTCDIVDGIFAHWILADGNGSDLFLLSINVETHAVEQIPLPKLSTPHEKLIRQLCCPIRNKMLLFCGIWEGSLALFEKQKIKRDPRRMVYTVWAMHGGSGGDSNWIEKTTFVVNFGFRRFIECVFGKLLVERHDGLYALFDLETRETEVLGRTKFLETEEEIEARVDSHVSSTWSAEYDNLSKEQYRTLMLNGALFNRKVVVEYSEFANTRVASAHEFVGTLVSIQGFKPIRSFGRCAEFTVFWPNLPAFGSKSPWVSKRQKKPVGPRRCRSSGQGAR